MKLETPLSLDGLAVAATDSDADLERKVDAELPKALLKAGTAAAEKAWEALQKTFGSGPISFTATDADRLRFVTQKAKEFAADPKNRSAFRLKLIRSAIALRNGLEKKSRARTPDAPSPAPPPP